MFKRGEVPLIKPKVSTTVTETDWFKRFKTYINTFKYAYVTVGVHEGAGEYPNGVSVVEVALWNEFGTEKTPERSWLRSTVNENESTINGWRQEMMENIIFKKWTVQQALEAIGMRLQILLQNKIKSNVPPELAESTRKSKEARGIAPVTLIDSTLMLRSVTYKVFVG